MVYGIKYDKNSFKLTKSLTIFRILPILESLVMMVVKFQIFNLKIDSCVMTIARKLRQFNAHFDYDQFYKAHVYTHVRRSN